MCMFKYQTEIKCGRILMNNIFLFLKFFKSQNLKNLRNISLAHLSCNNISCAINLPSFIKRYQACDKDVYVSVVRLLVGISCETNISSVHLLPVILDDYHLAYIRDFWFADGYGSTVVENHKIRYRIHLLYLHMYDNGLSMIDGKKGSDDDMDGENYSNSKSDDEESDEDVDGDEDDGSSDGSCGGLQDMCGMNDELFWKRFRMKENYDLKKVRILELENEDESLSESESNFSNVSLGL